ncbi:hypothetical protein GCM10023115_24290 [Pontixanthobacter gangjinensis]|uniref:Uncharacterized protein n=1 Tax=Pontixanthobacter gangjinensis TaxID=1028742 RepID=A0A6I4SQL0_9SPHN|nr:hypothetical protein [Pontixanthobacter gangjinensis]MXO57668.1 hypothetical protein [Pontixanthobacter gangjinensis]
MQMKQRNYLAILLCLTLPGMLLVLFDVMGYSLDPAIDVYRIWMVAIAVMNLILYFIQKKELD